jgi:hypothetical protein
MGGGMILFLIWATTVFWLALQKRMKSWSVICLVPLLAVALGYYLDAQAGRGDPFHVRPLEELLFFCMCLVTASSAITTMLVPDRHRPKTTLWQRLLQSRVD